MHIGTSIRSCLTLAIVMFSSATLAQEQALNYTYLEGGYVSSSFDNPGDDVDGDGVAVDGSLAVTDRLFLLGEYSNQDLDSNLDLDKLELGLGGHMPLADGLDVVGTVSYVYTNVDFGPGDADDDAIGLGVGLRGRLTDRFEMQGGVKYADIELLSDDILFSVDGRYYFTPQLALGAGAEAGDDMSVWNVGVRYEFR
jgi:hypothetical protein